MGLIPPQSHQPNERPNYSGLSPSKCPFVPDAMLALSSFRRLPLASSSLTRPSAGSCWKPCQPFLFKDFFSCVIYSLACLFIDMNFPFVLPFLLTIVLHVLFDPFSFATSSLRCRTYKSQPRWLDSSALQTK